MERGLPTAAWGKLSSMVWAPDGSFSSGGAALRARLAASALPSLSCIPPARGTAAGRGPEGAMCAGVPLPRCPSGLGSAPARPAPTPCHKAEVSFILKGKEFTSPRPTRTQIQINFSQSAVIGEN